MAIIAFADSISDVDVIPTGLFLDKLTGIGGIPRGVITEIFGDEGIGKSSLCLQIVASAQKQGLKCLWADVEWSYSPRYAESLGVGNSKLGLLRERFAEDILDSIEEAVDTGEWDLVVLDSVGGILPKAEAEKDSEGRTIGGQASLIAKFCRKVVPLLSIHNVALVAINHAYTEVMGHSAGKLMTSGGKKLAYHKALSIRLKTKQGVSLKQGDRKVGKVVVAEVRKNKLAGTEGLELDGQLLFGEGFSASADLLSDALDKGVIVKRGTTYYLGEEKLAVGLSKVRQAIEADAVLAEKIKLQLNA